MTPFLLIALALSGLAVAFVAWPLWRPLPDAGVDADADALALALAVPAPRRGMAIGLGVALLLFTAFMYAMVGTPAALLPQTDLTSPSSLAAGDAEGAGGDDGASSAPADTEQRQAGSGAGGMTPAQIEGMVARLAQRLQAQPDDVAGWRMLVRSYETLGRYAEAVDAWRRLLPLSPDDPDLLTDYAVTLGMSQGQTLAGEPEEAINHALRLNPQHVQALALSGSAAFERADYPRAIAQWRRILEHVPADADVRTSIERQIARAQALAERDKAGRSGR